MNTSDDKMTKALTRAINEARLAYEFNAGSYTSGR